MKNKLRNGVLVGLLATALVTAVAHGQVTGLAGWDIYIDPGHSQTENMGIFGYSEAEKNVRVGLHLRELLLAMTDIDTVYNSRLTDQESVSLTQRTDEANSLGAAWFHSIHSDAGPAQANSTLLLWGQLRNGEEKVPNGGKAMGDIIIGLLTRAMRTDTRGSIGDCSFFGCTSTGPYLSVNRRSTMPSELSEAGFHTSPLQNPRNMNEEWKRLEAYAFFWSILELHGLERPPVAVVTGFIQDVEKDRPLNGARVRIGGQEYVTDTYASLFNRYSSDPEQLQNGFYFVEGLTNETLDLVVDADGFYADTTTVVVMDSFFTFVDVELVSAQPPVVETTKPEADATSVPPADDVVINFSRRMDISATGAAIEILPEVDFTSDWQDGNRTLVITPDTLANLTVYTVAIKGSAQDLVGHSFDGNADGVGGDDFSFSFMTQPVDTQAPTVRSVYPAAEATEVENPPVVNFEFDEIINENTIGENAIELMANQTPISGTVKHYIIKNQSLISFFPTQTLAAGARHTIRLQTGLEDLFGNAMQSGETLSFTAVGAVLDVRRIDNFETNVTENWWAPQQSGSTRGIISDQTSRGTNRTLVNFTNNSRQSMQLNYGWDKAAGSWLIREFLSGGPPRGVLFDDSYILQMYVFGDGSGNKIRIAVDDRYPNSAAGNHEVSEWYTIDWIGWRPITWNLGKDPVGSWLGDGRLDGTLRIDSIQLTHTAGAAETGVLYLDDLQLLRAKPTSVREDVQLPRDFVLEQNYPNPFNPTTTIRFSIPEKPQHVKLVVYDMLGRVVQTLVDDRLSAGSHSVAWNGRDPSGVRVSSGTYFYKLEASGFVDTKRMLLLK